MEKMTKKKDKLVKALIKLLDGNSFETNLMDRESLDKLLLFIRKVTLVKKIEIME